MQEKITGVNDTNCPGENEQSEILSNENSHAKERSVLGRRDRTKKITDNQSAYIHICCDETGQIEKIIRKYGFECEAYGIDAELSQLYTSIHGSSFAIIVEPQNSEENLKRMSYQIREARLCGIEVAIICRSDYSEIHKKFEAEEGITLIKSDRPRTEIFHVLFIEKLCRLPQTFNDSDCRRDEHGEIIRHAIDAWRGVAASEKFIADSYMSGEVLPNLLKQAVFWYNRAKEHGSLRAGVSLGDCYFSGLGCPENKKKAYEMYCDAADMGVAEGHFKVGYCLLEGYGCETDLLEAYRSLRRAVELGRELYEAEYCVGVCLRDGKGVEVSVSEAKGHFLKSAKGNYSPALVALGDIYSARSGDDFNPALAFEYYSRAADNGSVEGLYKKGLALSFGQGCEQNTSEAFRCFSIGAEKKDEACLCALGMCYEYGIGCDYDFETAVSYYSLAADRGYAAAVNNLGGCYYYGHGVYQDKKRAMELFERASLLGDSNATTRLGICYQQGDECEQNPHKAFSYFSAAEQQGNAIAAYKKALCFEVGQGIEQSFKGAFESYQRAASLGHTESMWHAANYLSDGVGTPRDYWAAYKWYSKAAEQGHADSFYQMAHFSFKGIGTVKNYTKAFFCYNKAFELGASRMDCALRIGICLLRGLGVKENRFKALEWFKRAAALGSSDAMFLCGESLFFGSGCQQNYFEAAKYYASAINAGHTRAILSLAYCYESGLGVPKNINKAYSLYIKATEQDSPEANYKAAELMAKAGEYGDTLNKLLNKSANKGYVPAVLMLGILYDEGLGLPENADKAAQKYQKAISLGISKQRMLLFSFPERDTERVNAAQKATVDATYRLGMLRGRYATDPAQFARAFEYIAGAAVTGSEKAQREIAKIYEAGGDLNLYFKGTRDKDIQLGAAAVAGAMNRLGDTWFDGKPLLSKNDRAAFKCYKIAAEMGSSDAAYSLGWCLRHGVGTKVNDVEAAKWLKKSADSGNPHAAYSYGLCCEEGSGMEHPNLREAANYYRKAAAAGHVEAKKRHVNIMGK
ncbi:MAG: SEL1-like repeat protein [Ruminococcaceae bacterium]|nr:SEL1-like repeat protein [Oscillospiraceae bacterium]